MELFEESLIMQECIALGQGDADVLSIIPIATVEYEVKSHTGVGLNESRNASQ